MKKIHLLIVDSKMSFGRAVIGAELGRALVERGDWVHVLTSNADERVFSFMGLSCQSLPDLPGLLLQCFLDDVVTRVLPASIVLCDGQSVLEMLARAGLDETALTHFGIPVMGIDTWVSDRTGTAIDLFANRVYRMVPWPDGVLRLVTVPIGWPTNGDGICQILPSGRRLDAAERAKFRDTSGIAGPTVVLATAAWQHASFDDPDSAFVQRIVPETIARCVAGVPALHLHHVGPLPLPLEPILGRRYRWLGTLAPDAYHRTLASADALITLTPIATTVARALVSGVPVIWLRNSRPLSANDLGASGARRTASQRVYPFSVWPLGYHAFLRPILDGNPILDAIIQVETGEVLCLTETLVAMTTNGRQRRAAIEKEAGYVDAVWRLPGAAELVVRWSE